MTGPDRFKVPARGQALLGDKKTEDLLDADVEITIEGTTARVTGTVRNVAEEWTAFDSQNNTGHFFPLLLPEECRGKEVTVKGRTDGDRTVTIDGDLLLIQRLENLQGSTMELWMDGSLYLTVDFAGAERG